MAPVILGGDPTGGAPEDPARLMGTLVTEIRAQTAAMRAMHEDLVASLAAAKDYTGGTTSRRARTGLSRLAGNADPGAGQTTSVRQPGTPGRPVPDPGAGRVGARVPHTVEDAREAALGQTVRYLFAPGSSSPSPGVAQLINALAGYGRSRGRYGGAGGYGYGYGVGGAGAGGVGAGGPAGAGVPGAGAGGGGGGPVYVPGYGFYNGPGTPPPGRGGGHAVPPSGGGHGGGGGTGGLLGMAASRVPVIGLAVNALDEARTQRNRNAYYQNVEGGSNAGGFGERLHEELYRWSTFPMFSSEEARAAFKGVTRIGYNGRTGAGPGRQEALDFIYHGKSAYGATVDESLTELQDASKSALTPLGDLSKALKQLSDDAGKAGENAQMARSQMMGYFNQAVSAGYGSGSVAAASSVADTMASYGRSYADSSAAGQLTSTYGRYAAAQAGMTYGQLTALQKSNPQAAANIRTGVGLQAASQVLSPQMQSYLKQRIAAYGGRVDEATSLQISADFMRQFGRQVDPDVLTGSLSALTGISFSDYDHALGWVAMQMSGNTEASRAAGQAPSDYTGLGRISDAQAKTWGLGATTAQALMKSPGAAKSIASGGTIDPVLAALASKVDVNKEQVAVHTASGMRVVSLAEAMAKHPNEVASGSVQFVSPFSRNLGKTVSDIVGSRVDTNRDWSAEATSADTSGQALSSNKFASAVVSGGTAAAPGGTQKVTVDLTADARKLLTVLGSTGTAGAAGEAAPPLNPFAANPSLNR